MKFVAIVLALVISADAIKVKQEVAAKTKNYWAKCSDLEVKNHNL